MLGVSLSDKIYHFSSQSLLVILIMMGIVGSCVGYIFGHTAGYNKGFDKGYDDLFSEGAIYAEIQIQQDMYMSGVQAVLDDALDQLYNAEDHIYEVSDQRLQSFAKSMRDNFLNLEATTSWQIDEMREYIVDRLDLNTTCVYPPWCDE